MPRKPTLATIDLQVYRSAAGDLDTEQDQAIQALTELRTLPVINEDGRQFALSLCRQVKLQHTTLDDRRKSVTQPLNAVIREINGWFKPVLSALAEAEGILKGKLLDYETTVAETNRRALLEAAAAPTLRGAELALATVREAPEPLPGTAVRTTWVVHVVAPEDVPRVYCSPDPAKLQAALKETLASTGVPPQIPGVVFAQEKTLAVATR